MLSVIASFPLLNIIFYIYLCVSFALVVSHLKMDFMRIFQRIKEPVPGEIDVLKRAVKEKEQLIDDDREKIAKLQAEVDELKNSNASLTRELKERDDMNDVVVNYERLMEKLMEEHKATTAQCDYARNHLANLELAFSDLVEKYEHAKTIIVGYEENERSFVDHLGKFEEAIQRIERRYAEFKSYAVEKLNEANRQLQSNDEEYVTEVAKLKAKIVQGHVRMKEMERQLARLSTKSEGGKMNGLKRHQNSIFEPLVNNIS